MVKQIDRHKVGYSMKIVMISGHFDPFHDGHLDYIEQAMPYGDFLICVVSSDQQLLMKKGIVNIPEEGRQCIVHLILRGLGIPALVVLNTWDTQTTLVAEALQQLKPDIFCRGGDKTLADMPLEERKVCEDLGILIVHTEFRINRHGSEMLHGGTI